MKRVWEDVFVSEMREMGVGSVCVCVCRVVILACEWEIRIFSSHTGKKSKN